MKDGLFGVENYDLWCAGEPKPFTMPSPEKLKEIFDYDPYWVEPVLYVSLKQWEQWFGPR